MEYLFVTCRTV